MIRRPPRSTQSRSSAASDVYKRQETVVVLAERLVGADSCSHHRLRSARTCPESAKNSPPGSDSRSTRPPLAGKDVPRPLGVDGLSSQYSNVNWQASLLGSDRDMPGRRSAVAIPDGEVESWPDSEASIGVDCLCRDRRNRVSRSQESIAAGSGYRFLSCRGVQFREHRRDVVFDCPW